MQEGINKQGVTNSAFNMSMVVDDIPVKFTGMISPTTATYPVKPGSVSEKEDSQKKYLKC